MLSSGANVIIWDKMLSSGAYVTMVSSGANVIICCYHVMLSSGMITHPFFIFPENFTHSYRGQKGFSDFHLGTEQTPLLIINSQGDTEDRLYENGKLHGTATFTSHTGDREERCYVSGRFVESRIET
jgi:hypothetical protein